MAFIRLNQANAHTLVRKVGLVAKQMASMNVRLLIAVNMKLRMRFMISHPLNINFQNEKYEGF